MKTKILKGKDVVKEINKNLILDIQNLKKNNIIPGLAAILVGNDSASQVYIKSKEKAFEKLNCHTETFLFSENSNDDEIILLINQLNEDPNFHGILIQLPLPKKFNTKKILHSVNPNKDVDGLHPYNLGLLLEGNPNFIPCTPNGIIQILKFNNISE